MKSITELRSEGATRYVFPDENKVRFFMDFRVWEGVPSDRIFYHDQDLTNNNVELVAVGYGARDSYGNGSIYVSKELLPEPTP